MRLADVRQGSSFRIFCEATDDGTPPFLQFINELEDTNKKAHQYLVRRMAYFAETGTYGDSKVCHDVCKKPLIFQWRASNIRVLWVYDAGKCVVVCHWFQKTKGKTKKADIDTAKAFLTRYNTAKESNTLTIERD